MKPADLRKIIKEEIQSVIKELSEWETETDTFKDSLTKWLDYMISQGDSIETLRPEIERMLDEYEPTAREESTMLEINSDEKIGKYYTKDVNGKSLYIYVYDTYKDGIYLASTIVPNMQRARIAKIPNIDTYTEVDEQQIPKELVSPLKLGASWFSSKTDLKELVKGGKLDVLTNAADDINTQYFRGRGQIDRSNYRLAVRDNADNVLNTLEKNTKVVKKTKGFTAKDDEAQEYYQLPEFNVAISLDSYKVSRATVIQFLSFDGEKPEGDKLYQ